MSSAKLTDNSESDNKATISSRYFVRQNTPAASFSRLWLRRGGVRPVLLGSFYSEA